MERFLELTARDLYNSCKEKAEGLSGITVVFPNRRARLFFDEYLSNCSDKPLWSPAYMTIEELFQSYSPLEVADQCQLISILYRIYKEELHTSESLDSFWSWGELMLRDFDDIDRNMADAEKLLACLDNQKEIDGMPFLSKEQTEILQHFFDGFNGEQTDLRQKYTTIWKALGPIYNKFRSELQQRGIAYNGMLQREVASTVNSETPGDNVFAFVGFNSLDKAERTLFLKLKECGKALFYWDFDISYIDDKSQEAGMFMRQNLAEFPNRLDAAYFNNSTSDKELAIIETSSDNAQARYIPEWLESLPGKAGTETAIVLCDSGLLQPVLHTIPAEVTDNVNITMGFQLSSTPLSGFISAIIDIQNSLLKNEKRITLEQAGRILANPLTERISENAASLFKELRDSHRCYPDMADLRRDNALASVFNPCTDNISLLDNIMAILRILAGNIDQESGNTLFVPLYSEAVFRVYTQIGRFRTLTEDGTLDISPDMMCRLLKKVIRGLTVPFHGEPAIGMQIMGMIETRNLDFRNILLLSASEGTLPSADGEASFIPYSIRSAFGLTTMREKSAVAAYNFHHLLQRAEKVTMVYNGNPDSTGLGKGQISRYLLQLIVSGRPIHRITLEPDHVEHDAAQAISVAKTDEIMSRLYDRYDASKGGSYMSPSALNCYLDCRLKYYLLYVADIKPKKNDPSGIDPSLFGTLFHRSAELAYDALAADTPDSVITLESLERLIKNKAARESYISQAFNEELFNRNVVDKSDYNGTQSVNFEVISRYLKQMLSMDRIYAPFKYIGGEAHEFSHIITLPHPDRNGQELGIRISGRIDRIDCKNGIYRIADYKTGHVEENPKELTDLFLNDKKRHKYALQTFYYATLVHNSREFGDKRLAPTVLYLRRSAKPDPESIYMKMDGEPITDFSRQFVDEYTGHLRETISSIFDRSEPFSQTGIEDTCRNCDFKALCRKVSR